MNVKKKSIISNLFIRALRRVNGLFKSNLSRILLLLSFMLFTNFNGKQTQEYEYKAAFIERFTRFVEWPAELENRKFNNTFQIAVLGKNPFHYSLDNLFNEVKIKGQKVKIIYTDKITEASTVNLVFISNSESKRVKEHLKVFEDKPILIISDSRGFCEKGTHINMYEDGHYIRFEINKEAIKKSGLTVSSLLLTSAKIVKTDD